MKHLVNAAVLLAAVCALAAPVSAARDSAHNDGLILPVRVEPYSWSPPGGPDNPTNVALFQNNLPWGSNTDANVLAANFIPFTVFNSGAMGSANLAPFDKILLSNQQDFGYTNAVITNRAWFENYVSGGKCILNGMAHFFGDLPIGAQYPGGVSLALEAGNQIVSIQQPAHPLMTTPNPIGGAQLNNWNFSSHGDLANGGLTIVQNADFSQGPCLTVKPLGSGSVTSTTQPYQWSLADAAFAENIVLYSPCGGATPVEPATWGAIKNHYTE
jgi:hypothetical protein